MTNMILRSALISVLAFAPISAPASTVLEQSPIFNGGGIDSTLNTVSPFTPGRAFEDFKLTSSATVTTLTWWRFDFVDRPTIQNFSVQFLSSGTGLGLPVIATPLYDFTVQAQAIGPRVNFTDVYKVTLPQPVLLAANTDYWLSIASLDQGNGFTWSRSNPAPSPGGTFLPGVSARLNSNTGVIGLNGLDVAFALGTSPAVPEPSTWAMLILGFGGVGAALRARRTAAVRPAVG